MRPRPRPRPRPKKVVSRPRWSRDLNIPGSTGSHRYGCIIINSIYCTSEMGPGADPGFLNWKSTGRSPNALKIIALSFHFISLLLPYVTVMVNYSLRDEWMRSSPKQAVVTRVVTPLLMKSSLDAEKLCAGLQPDFHVKVWCRSCSQRTVPRQH